MPSIASRSTKKIERLWKSLTGKRDSDPSRDREESAAIPRGHGPITRHLHKLKNRAAHLGRRILPQRRKNMLPPALRAKPWLLISCTVFLVCLVAIVIGRQSPPPDDSADFDLRDADSSSNLVRTSAEQSAHPAEPPPQHTVALELPPPPAPQAEAPIVVQRELPPVVQVKTEDVIPPLPPPPENKGPADLPPPAPMKLEPPAPAAIPEAIHLNETVPVSKEDFEPELSDPIIDWHRGDVPMMRNWHKVLGYQAVLAAAMLAGPASADDAKNNSDKPAGLDTKAMKEQLDRIEESTKTLGTIKQEVGGLKEEIKLLRKSNTAEFEAVSRRVGELEKKLAALESKLGTRVANFPAPNGTRAPNIPPTNGTASTTGHIRLVNSYRLPARVILNGLAYRLNPGEIQEVSVPAGNFTSEVLVEGWGSAQAPLTKQIAANETRLIEIYAR
jgi:hypothetical protein